MLRTDVFANLLAVGAMSELAVLAHLRTSAPRAPRRGDRRVGPRRRDVKRIAGHRRHTPAMIAPTQLADTPIAA